MKTAILTSAMIILMTAAYAGTAIDSATMKNTRDKNNYVWVIKSESDMIKFNVANPEHEKVVLKIYNEDQVKVFQKTIKNEDAIRINCDLSVAGKGDYTCIIKRNGREDLKKLVTVY